MTGFHTPGAVASDLLRDRRAVVGILFGLMLVPLVASVGVAVDYARAEQLRTALQAAVDAAALAGAGAGGAFQPPDDRVARSVATSYMNASLAELPTTAAVSVVVTPKSEPGTGYDVTVGATTVAKTTFMSLFTPSLGVGASATARNPTLTVTIGGADFKSDAADRNTVYFYTIPANGELPSPKAFAKMPSYSNADKSAPTISLAASATQKIGAVLENITGGLQPYPKGATNAYGGKQGSVHYFYSSLPVPNESSRGYRAVTQNCSLEVLSVSDPAHPPQVPQGQCSAHAPPLAAPSCNDLATPVHFAWNDMGGVGYDDKDYNDMEYDLSCANPNGPKTVVLVK